MTPSEQDDPASPGGPVTPPPTPPPSPASGTATTAATLKPTAGLTPGQILGNRYRITGMLGRGGMGEVWQAYDLKLQVDVALKSIRVERFPGDKGLELLRREVRSAREVMSPNVCRIFDLIDEGGQEFVSMEYIDGQTLLELLRERGPLELQEATRIASQFLAGLESIHQSGLVHRDVKPENIMITRTNRVVLMDFGVAKGMADDQRGTIAGTPAYMAPEQLRGEAIDPRADIFAAGVVLAEMISPEGVKDLDSRESLWGAVREAPGKLFESPWRGVLERALSAAKTQRYGSARELARALEEVTLRVAGAEDKRPYPGLESFTEADAEFFFGREVEVEAVWKKLQRANLLAIIGPSGAGKSSFLQAGLIPAKPEGWRHVILRPGSSPFVALARALAPELTADRRALDHLLQIEDPEKVLAGIAGWKTSHSRAMIVLDQFEELFTLCRPEVQTGFADLLGRLAVEADVHVLLVMRDDFLFRCHEHPLLAPIFSELTPLGPPTGSALRRALVQPALLCGYRFEDESLADEMLAAIKGERGALPLLAFAAARLWEQRDREKGLLTREACERIGGVSGALAQHAEATLERIGGERQPVVREIFRNLVTAQGTRAVADVDELLSVFEDGQVAEAVLRELVNARLLTSFELPEPHEQGREKHRVEIVHESLLTRWPRLVHWQTQDTEGAQLRDQLRQAAHLWKERHESEDLLWAGTAFKEFELWRERYPGRLTATEEAFAQAMITKAGRQRRRRRIALASAFAVLLVVLAIFGMLWQRSVRMTGVSEARRLHMLAENALETDNTLALALATASLEREDNPAVRRTALKALWRAPTHFRLSSTDTLGGFFATLSPDGRWLAVPHGHEVLLYPRDGGAPRQLEVDAALRNGMMYDLDFHPQGNLLLGNCAFNESWWHVLWSVPEGRVLRTWKGGTSEGQWSFLRGDPPQVLVAGRDDPAGPLRWRRYSLDRDEPEDLGRADADPPLYGRGEWTVDPTGRYLLGARGTGVYLFPLDSLETAPPRLIGRHDHGIWGLGLGDSGAFVVSADKLGQIRVWSRGDGGAYTLVLKHQTDETVVRFVGFDHSISRVVYREKQIRQVALLDRMRPEALPTLFWPLPSKGDRNFQVPVTDFTPDDSWIVFSQDAYPGARSEILFYPLVSRFPRIFRVFPEDAKLQPLCFVADGSRLVTTRIPELRIFDIHGGDPRGTLLWEHPTGQTIATIAVDSLSVQLLGGSFLKGEGWLIPLDGSTPRALVHTAAGSLGGVALSPDGRYAAAGSYWGYTYTSEQDIRVWDLATGTARVLASGGKAGCYGLCFLPGPRLLSSSAEGLLLWDLATGGHEILSTREHRWIGGVDARGRYLVVDTPLGVTLWDLEKRTERILPIPSDGWIGSDWTASNRLGIAPDGRFVVAGMRNGDVWVLRLGDDQPHLLLGHQGGVGAVWIPPESDRIFTAAEDGTVRIWDVPDGTPLQTLSLPQLLMVLRTQTNLRIMLDDRATDGYRIEFDRFPGWETAPTWQNVHVPPVASASAGR